MKREQPNAVTVTWTSADGQGYALTGYVVTASRDGHDQNQVVAAPTATSVVITGLAGGLNYTFAAAGLSECGVGARQASAQVKPAGTPTTYASTVLADAPVAYYRLGETSELELGFGGDSSGKGHLLAYSRAYLGDAGALVEDEDTGAGADGSCCIGTATGVALPLYDDARSFEAWVKPLDGAFRWIGGWGRNQANRGFNIGLSDSSLALDAYYVTVSVPLERSLVDGAWHHVVVTYNEGSARFFVDGASAGSRPVADRLDTFNDSGLVLGAYQTGAAPLYGGLDDVAVYRTALTSAQVAAHFDASEHARPSAPAGVTASYGGPNAVQVTWGGASAPFDAVTHYVVQARAQGANVNALAVPGDGSAAVITGLVKGRSYTFSVTASTAYGDGPAKTSKPFKVTGANTTYAQSVLDDAPARYYRLGEADGLEVGVGGDSSGHGHLLTYSDVSVQQSGGLLSDPDTAVSGDGSCCIGRSSAAELPIHDAARSVEAWVKPADTPLRWMVGWGRSAANGGFNIGLSSSVIALDTYQGGAEVPLERSLIDGAWHHVVVTYANRTARFYLDGALVGSRTLADPLDTYADSGLVVGAYQSGGTPVNGGLDEVAIYPSALATADVKAHFAASGHSRPGAVDDVVAVAGTNSAKITWTPLVSVDPVRRYVITASRGGTPQNQIVVAGDLSKATLTGLAGDTAYSFTVAAMNAYGVGPASTSSAVTPTGASVTYASTVLAHKPVAYYRLDESAIDIGVGGDSSGKGHPLTYLRGLLALPGALASDPDTGARGDAGCCIGTTYGVALPVGAAARTVEAWIQPVDGYSRYVAGWGARAGNEAFNLAVSSTEVVVNNWESDVHFPVTHSIGDGAWHHVVVTYQGLTARAYLDGESLGSQMFAAALNTRESDVLFVGAANDGSSPTYGGLDEVAVYPAALTGAQVTAHFNASGHSRPAEVTKLAATAGKNLVKLTWKPPPGGDPPSHVIVQAFVGGAPANSVIVAGDATGTTMTGLAGGKKYSFRVTPVNAYGDGADATSSEVTPTGDATTYASAVVAAGPVAYYRLGETSDPALWFGGDSSGKKHPVAYSRAYLQEAGALANDGDTAARGDGSCCVGTAAGVALPDEDAARTVEAWIKPLDDAQRWIAGWGERSTNHAFNVGASEYAVYAENWGVTLTFATDRSMLDDAWHHVVVTYNGTTVRAYLDGQALGSKEFPEQLATAAVDELVVGAANDGRAPTYGGLDEVAIYPVALSSAQVADHFSASAHRRSAQVANLQASGAANRAVVSWDSPKGGSDPLLYYVIRAYVGGTARNSLVVSGDAAAATITGLQGGKKYTFVVTPVNAYGSGESATSSSVTPSGGSVTYASAVMADAPSAYYRLGEATGLENAFGGDSSSSGRLLRYSRLTLGETGAIAGDPDSAAAADGYCCIGVAHGATLPHGDEARTIEAWVKPGDGTARWVAGWGGRETNRAFNLAVSGTAVIANNWETDLTFTADHAIDDGAWHHVVITYGRSTVSAYLDGEPLGTQTFPLPLDTLGADELVVGASNYGGSPFHGGLDEVAVYPSALSPAQVAAHYKASGHTP